MLARPRAPAAHDRPERRRVAAPAERLAAAARRRFLVGRPEYTSSLLLRAGFEDVALEPYAAPQWIGESVEHAAAFLRDGEVNSMFEGPAPADAEAALAAIADALQPFLTADGVAVEGDAWVVSARRAG